MDKGFKLVVDVVVIEVFCVRNQFGFWIGVKGVRVVIVVFSVVVIGVVVEKRKEEKGSIKMGIVGSVLVGMVVNWLVNGF